MENKELKLDLNEKDLALVCLSIEVDHLRKSLNQCGSMITNEARKYKNQVTLLSAITVTTLYTSYQLYKKLEKARSVINKMQERENLKNDEN